MKKVKTNSFATMVVAIFLIFNILSIFLFTYYVSVREESKVKEYAKDSLKEIVDEKSTLISLSFSSIEDHARLLGKITEKLIEKGNEDYTLHSDYVINNDGIITRKKNANISDLQQSCIIVPSTDAKTGELYNEINLTEELDEFFAPIIKTEDLTWAYIVTENNILRVSPYNDIAVSFGKNHNHTADVFYKIANEKNNPERKAVWTKPYTDYLGQGWMRTCSQPIYDGDVFYGTVCLDISINSIKKKFFEDFKLGKTGKVYWLDNNGNIFYHPDYEENNTDQGEVYEKNIFEDGNLSNQKEKVLKTAISTESGMQSIYENGKNLLMVYSQIEGTDSTLVIEMNNEDLISENKIDADAAAILILIDFFITIIFAVVLYYRFSKPMNTLVKSAERISGGDYSYIKNNTDEKEKNIYEVEQLDSAFKVMANSIERYTESLLEKNKEISTIIETIEGSLMIATLNGEVIAQSKQTEGIDGKQLQQAINKIDKTGEGFTEQIVVNGQIYKNTYYPIGGESVDKIVISSECITDTILMEKEIQQIEKMAGVGQLSAAIVHELKNTLALIKGSVYILKMTVIDEEEKLEVAAIDKAVKDAENVIETLLDYSRRDSKGGEMIHIGTLINQILLLTKKELITRNIKVDTNIDDSAYIYSAGREPLKVVLQNIIINAVQAVDENGTIEIECKQNDKTIDISIKDSGGGITVEPIDKIFEPFITTKGTGTGIGLWITKRLLSTLKGNISVNSDTEEGKTEFIISVPKE